MTMPKNRLAATHTPLQHRRRNQNRYRWRKRHQMIQRRLRERLMMEQILTMAEDDQLSLDLQASDND